MDSMFVSSGVPKRSIDVLDAGKRYDYSKFQIEPVELFHDVQNYGLKIFMGGEKAIYITDTGFVDHIVAKNYDYYLLENNHNEEEIAKRIHEKQKRGEFAYEIRAAKTHLSKEQDLKWLAENASQKSKYIFLHQHKEA